MGGLNFGNGINSSWGSVCEISSSFSELFEFRNSTTFSYSGLLVPFPVESTLILSKVLERFKLGILDFLTDDPTGFRRIVVDDSLLTVFPSTESLDWEFWKRWKPCKFHKIFSHYLKKISVTTYIFCINTVCQQKGPLAKHENRKFPKPFQGCLGCW